MRKSDTSDAQFRRAADRIVYRDGQWFVMTREGIRGPFQTRTCAEAEMRHYVETMQFLEANRGSMPAHLDWGDVTVVDLEAPRWI